MKISNNIVVFVRAHKRDSTFHAEAGTEKQRANYYSSKSDCTRYTKVLSFAVTAGLKACECQILEFSEPS